MTTPAQIRSSSQVRQDFLDFFKSKQHTIVPSSSLMPDSPNLLFTNAGMNQFVPIFLGQTKCPYTPGRAADTQKCIRAGGKHNDLEDVGLDTYHHTFFEMLGNWSFGDYFKKEAIEWAWELVVEVWKFPPTRLYATVYSPDKSKNDPSEFDQEAWNHWAEKFRAVGLDPKIHIVNGSKKDNFWMMGETGPCGPCSELHVDLTPNGDTNGKLVNAGSPQCIEIWNLVFIQFNAQPVAAVCDRRDEEKQDRRSQTAATIEFVPLAQRHVDTGMGFERVTSIIQGTKGLKDFAHAKISNYETDIFRPIFDKLEQLSGKTYKSTLPDRPVGGFPAAETDPNSPVGAIPANQEGTNSPVGGFLAKKTDTNSPVGSLPAKQEGANSPVGGFPAKKTDPNSPVGGLPAGKIEAFGPADGQKTPNSSQIAIDIAFRVIADHIRTLSFAIADGIQPGNNDRNYVLRRILRRAVRYGRTLGFREPFFYKLVDVLADTMGDVFPEIRARKKQVQETIRTEEEAFNKTLDRGIVIFENDVLPVAIADAASKEGFECVKIGKTGVVRAGDENLLVGELQFKRDGKIVGKFSLDELLAGGWRQVMKTTPTILRWDAFKLYDTYGFPLDLTELMARERGLTVDKEGFEKLMEEQRARARAAQKKEVISVDAPMEDIKSAFVGYDNLNIKGEVAFAYSRGGEHFIAVKESPFYAEMGGQVGDTGVVILGGADTCAGLVAKVLNTIRRGSVIYLKLDRTLETVPSIRGRAATFAVEASRRHAIQRHHTVTHLLHWALHEVASREASQKGSFVGPEKLTFDFNSAPLTPQQVADIEKLVNERILENVAVSWTEVPYADVKSRKDVMQFFGDKYGDSVRVVQIGGHAAKLDGYSMELCGGTHTRATGEIGLFRIVGENAIAAGVRRIEAVAGLEAYRKAADEVTLIKSLAGRVNAPIHELDKKIEAMLVHQKELEKLVKAAQQREASNAASLLLEEVKTINGIPVIIHNLGAADGDFLQAIADSLKGRFKGVIILGGAAGGAVSLLAAVSPDFSHDVQAGKIMQQIAPIVGGRGGGKPDNARGGGKDASKLEEALAKAKSLLG